MTDTIKLSFNGNPVGWVLVKYISYQFDDDNTNAEDKNKTLEFFDSTSIIENTLSDNPTPPDSANIREILFTLDSTFLKYEARDKSGNMINLEYIPAKYIVDVDVWRNDFKVPSPKKLSKQLRHNLK